MAKFENAYTKTAANEGGYANDPNDKGGETWKGIARKANPGWQGWVVIDSYRNLPDFPKILYGVELLESLVRSLYRIKYWDEIQGDYILNQGIADSIYDSAVNMGPSRAIKLAQKALGLKESGKMDQVTLDRLNNKV